MQLIHDLEMENDPGLSAGPSGITRVLRRGRQEGRSQRRRCEDKQRSGRWALKVEEGATSHGRQAPEKREQARNGVLPGASGRDAALSTSRRQPHGADLGLVTSRTIR